MHHRKRHIKRILLKSAKIFPVLGVLGPRQVGKSTFLMKEMKEWSAVLRATYLTFDKQEIALKANRAPEQFLLNESSH
ncbi:AAA family ATPase [Coxiella-like endosymbiont]|uniref:AAA family ATPase n=1 Tax=Coxiella-like endosymbiont TaxID=1592897 RepID=UPI00272D8786|nr:AAA family ATPase [Coxiella-like endosymbiont]